MREGVSPVRVIHYGLVLAMLWSALISASLMWNVYQVRQEILDVARTQARVAYEKDVLYRRWNVGHGGVYVPVTAETPPNPYLEVPEREITTPAGKALTLMNPAYMTRQVHELAERAYGVRGHITSLNPIRPENTPDPWEARALKAFETGAKEVSSVEKTEGVAYMRLMRPLISEEGCLKCHVEQGYQLGDIRGGISVSLLMAPLQAIEQSHLLRLTIAHGILWVLGLLGIALGAQRLNSQVTERMRAEEELAQKTEELARSNAELEQFAYVASHDLQEPLRMISSYVQLLARRYEGRLDNDADDFIGFAVDGANRMQALIKDLLTYSRVGMKDKDFDTTDCEEVIANTLTHLQLVIEESNARVTHDHLPSVTADQSQLAQLFQNLVSNAIKFRSNGPPHIHISAEKRDNEWLFSVQDNGIGITPEYSERVFDIFQRLHGRDEYPGTGIGLAICKKIVECHGGRIWVASPSGNGSTFYFTLPLPGER